MTDALFSAICPYLPSSHLSNICTSASVGAPINLNLELFHSFFTKLRGRFLTITEFHPAVSTIVFPLLIYIGLPLASTLVYLFLKNWFNGPIRTSTKGNTTKSKAQITSPTPLSTVQQNTQHISRPAEPPRSVQTHLPSVPRTGKKVV